MCELHLGRSQNLLTLSFGYEANELVDSQLLDLSALSLQSLWISPAPAHLLAAREPLVVA